MRFLEPVGTPMLWDHGKNDFLFTILGHTRF